MYKCSIIECENESDDYFCFEHLLFLKENISYKVILCFKCDSIIRLEKSDQMILETSEICSECKNYSF